MKILHVLWYGDVGGVERYTRSLFAELERRGHENILVVNRPVEDVRVAGRALFNLPQVTEFSQSARAAVSYQLPDILRKSSPDVAFLHTTMNESASAAIVGQLPTVYFAHNYGAFCPAGTLYYRHARQTCEFDRAPRLGCLLNAYRKGCNTRRPGRLLSTYRRASQTQEWVMRTDMMVCDSEYVRVRHVRAGFDGRRIHVLPSPVPIPETLPSQPTVRGVVLFCGRLVQNKGLESLIDAMPRVPPPTRLVIAGDGPLRSRLELRAAENGVGGRVRFVGIQSEAELGELYTRAAVVACPSEWPEPFGMVGPEAMAHGRPVVGTAAGGSAEWLHDGVTGVVVPRSDPPSLAAAIQRLINDPNEAMRMGAAGRRMVEDRFSITAHAEGLLKVFRSAVEHHRRVA